MKNKIALFFLVTSFSMATTPVWAGNGLTPPSQNITLDKNTNTLNKNLQKEEKPEGSGSWFTKKNMGIATVIVLLAAGLMWNYADRSQNSSSKNK